MTAEISPARPKTKFSMYPLLWASVAFAFGIVLAEITGVRWVIWLTAAAIFTLAGFILRGKASSRYIALLCVLFAGASIHQFQISNVAEDRIKRIYDDGRVESGTAVEVEGTLIGLPEPAYDGVFIRLNATS